jgi:hypothetical protein
MGAEQPPGEIATNVLVLKLWAEVWTAYSTLVARPLHCSAAVAQACRDAVDGHMDAGMDDAVGVTLPPPPQQIHLKVIECVDIG